MKLNLKNSWKKFDTQNHVFLALQSKFDLQTSLISRYIFIPQLNTKIRKDSSDAEVVKQIWIQEEYKQPLELISQQIKLSNQPNILDFGANIGMASLYFKKQFPESKIIAFEPFEENRSMIHPEIMSSPKALWKTNTNLSLGLNFRDGKEWSIQVQENNNGSIIGANLMTILKSFNLDEVDILKIDIEGSEYPVFLEDTTIQTALQNIKSIIIEIHDDAGNREDLYSIIKSCNFLIYPLRELDVFINEKFITSN